MNTFTIKESYHTPYTIKVKPIMFSETFEIDVVDKEEKCMIIDIKRIIEKDISQKGMPKIKKYDAEFLKKIANTLFGKKFPIGTEKSVIVAYLRDDERLEYIKANSIDPSQINTL